MKTRHIDQIRFKKLVPVPQHHCMLSVTNGQIPVLRLVKPNRSCHGQSSWSRLSAHLHTEGARSSRSCLGSFCCLVSAWRQSFLQHLWECDEVRRRRFHLQRWWARLCVLQMVRTSRAQLGRCWIPQGCRVRRPWSPGPTQVAYLIWQSFL